jgi:hypothetical protein
VSQDGVGVTEGTTFTIGSFVQVGVVTTIGSTATVAAPLTFAGLLLVHVGAAGGITAGTTVSTPFTGCAGGGITSLTSTLLPLFAVQVEVGVGGDGGGATAVAAPLTAAGVVEAVQVLTETTTPLTASFGGRILHLIAAGATGIT